MMFFGDELKEGKERSGRGGNAFYLLRCWISKAWVAIAVAGIGWGVSGGVQPVDIHSKKGMEGKLFIRKKVKKGYNHLGPMNRENVW